MAFQVGAFQPFPAYQQVRAAQVHAGRRRRRYLVEVDGQEFEADSVQQAIAILDRARELAIKAAALRAQETIDRELPKAVRVGSAPRISLKTPKVSGSVELVSEVKRAQEAINKVYAEAAMIAELRLLEVIALMRDEEEAITLLLLSD